MLDHDLTLLSKTICIAMPVDLSLAVEKKTVDVCDGIYLLLGVRRNRLIRKIDCQTNPIQY